MRYLRGKGGRKRKEEKNPQRALQLQRCTLLCSCRWSKQHHPPDCPTAGGGCTPPAFPPSPSVHVRVRSVVARQTYVDTPHPPQPTAIIVMRATRVLSAKNPNAGDEIDCVSARAKSRSANGPGAHPRSASIPPEQGRRSGLVGFCC